MEVTTIATVGDLFIVPNSAYTLKSALNPELFIAECEKLSKTLNMSIDPQSAILIEVWTCDKISEDNGGCGNWHCHYKEVNDEEIHFPFYLPASLFGGKKEGDIISLTCNGFDIELTLDQLDYRYRRFGPFEKILNEIITARLAEDSTKIV